MLIKTLMREYALSKATIYKPKPPDLQIQRSFATVLHLFGALAEFERNLIQERTQAGLAAARGWGGRLGGRRRALNPEKRALAVSLYEEKRLPVGKICKRMGISKPTLYSYVRETQEIGK